MKTPGNLKNSEFIADRKSKTDYRKAKSPQGDINCRVIEKLIAKGGANFVRYLELSDLTNDPNILLLSPKNHYYYDLNELGCISTLIVMKKLNLIEHIDSFLDGLHKALSPGTNFIGYFSDSSGQSKSEGISIIYKKVTNFLDSKTDMGFDRESVSRLLESHGFQVVDMTVIKKLIYFRTRNTKRAIN
jgi:hypothetical protein